MTPQQKADRLRIFRAELQRLEDGKVIALTREQRDALNAHLDRTLQELAAHYDVDTSEEQARISWGMRIASTLGGLAFCAAAALFFARYLDLWPAWMQVAAMVLAPLLLTLAAEVAARREKSLYYAALLSVVAFAAFVIDLRVLGTLFNLAPSPNAFAAWGLFGLALAYHFRLRLLLAAGLVSVLGWMAAASSYWRGFWWLEWDRRPEDILAGGLLLAAAPLVIRHRSRADFPPVYRLCGLLAFFLAALYLSASGHRSYLPLDARTVERGYQIFGLAAAAAAVWLGIRNGWKEVVHLGTAFFTVFLVIRLVDWWWEAMPKYLFFLLVGLIALGLVAAFKRLRGRMRSGG